MQQRGCEEIADHCRNIVRMGLRWVEGDVEADGCSIVEDVHREAMEADHPGEAIDNVRDILERVVEGAPGRHIGLPESRQVGRDKAKGMRSRNMWPAVGKPCNSRSGGASFGPASR